MKRARTAHLRGEGGIAFVIIVLVIVGGIGGWLYVARQNAEKDIRIFAADVAKRMAVDYDAKYLNTHLSRDARGQMMASWRDRFFEQLQGLGVPTEPIEVDGNPEFTSVFFDPHGMFRAHLKYPTATAELEMGLSRGMTMWQIDTIAVIWTPPPATPTPEPVAAASPTPAPVEKGKHKPKR